MVLIYDNHKNTHKERNRILKIHMKYKLLRALTDLTNLLRRRSVFLLYELIVQGEYD